MKLVSRLVPKSSRYIIVAGSVSLLCMAGLTACQQTKSAKHHPVQPPVYKLFYTVVSPDVGSSVVDEPLTTVLTTSTGSSTTYSGSDASAGSIPLPPSSEGKQVTLTSSYGFKSHGSTPSYEMCTAEKTVSIVSSQTTIALNDFSCKERQPVTLNISVQTPKDAKEFNFSVIDANGAVTAHTEKNFSISLPARLDYSTLHWRSTYSVAPSYPAADSGSYKVPRQFFSSGVFKIGSSNTLNVDESDFQQVPMVQPASPSMSSLQYIQPHHVSVYWQPSKDNGGITKLGSEIDKIKQSGQAPFDRLYIGFINPVTISTFYTPGYSLENTGIYYDPDNSRDDMVKLASDIKSLHNMHVQVFLSVGGPEVTFPDNEAGIEKLCVNVTKLADTLGLSPDSGDGINIYYDDQTAHEGDNEYWLGDGDALLNSKNKGTVYDTLLSSKLGLNPMNLFWQHFIGEQAPKEQSLTDLLSDSEPDKGSTTYYSMLSKTANFESILYHMNTAALYQKGSESAQKYQLSLTISPLAAIPVHTIRYLDLDDSKKYQPVRRSSSDLDANYVSLYGTLSQSATSVAGVLYNTYALDPVAVDGFNTIIFTVSNSRPTNIWPMIDGFSQFKTDDWEQESVKMMIQALAWLKSDTTVDAKTTPVDNVGYKIIQNINGSQYVYYLPNHYNLSSEFEAMLQTKSVYDPDQKKANCATRSGPCYHEQVIANLGQVQQLYKDPVGKGISGVSVWGWGSDDATSQDQDDALFSGIVQDACTRFIENPSIDSSGVLQNSQSYNANYNCSSAI